KLSLRCSESSTTSSLGSSHGAMLAACRSELAAHRSSARRELPARRKYSDKTGGPSLAGAAGRILQSDVFSVVPSSEKPDRFSPMTFRPLRTAVCALALLVPLSAVGCSGGGDEHIVKSKVKAGDMPSEGSWRGVWYSQL